MYNKNAKELEESFNIVMIKHNLNVLSGIKDGYLSLEDGIPWLEVYSNKNISVKKGKEIIQDLANELNIQMIFNRVENHSEGGTLMAFLDLNYETFNNNPEQIIKALTEDPEVVKYIEEEGFGKIIKPKK